MYFFHPFHSLHLSIHWLLQNGLICIYLIMRFCGDGLRQNISLGKVEVFAIPAIPFIDIDKGCLICIASGLAGMLHLPSLNILKGLGSWLGCLG